MNKNKINRQNKIFTVRVKNDITKKSLKRDVSGFKKVM